MIEKCKYYNDAHSACSLMIDDIVPVLISNNGAESARNDWGYLMDQEGSLYNYFKKNLLQKYPEIKGTVFLPLRSQDHIPTDRGYSIFKKNVEDQEFLMFLKKISTNFEMAFHGNRHEYRKEDGEYIHECFAINSYQANQVISIVNGFQEKTKINFTGGKYPGYNFNDKALEIIKKLDAKWWALYVDMINNVNPANAVIFDEKLNIVLIPTNVSGDIFHKYFEQKKTGFKSLIKNGVRFLIGRHNNYDDPIKYLNYLYLNRLPIIIQEHFQNQKTNGRRQTPNIYDDIWSLDLIYAFLKGKDIWYATCGEIAHYYESFIHCSISIEDQYAFKLNYNGIYDKPFISIKLSTPKLFHIESNTVSHGVFKNNEYWVFDDVEVGSYRIII